MPRFCGGTRVTSTPAIVTVPGVERSSPAMARSRVDLPEPLGPSRAVSEPEGISRLDVVEGDEVAVVLAGVR